MMDPIRILHVVNSMGMGGAENFIMNAYRKMDRTKVQFDFAVHIPEPAFFDEEIKKMGGRIYHFPKFNGKNIIDYNRIWNQFFKEHPEILVVHGHMGSSAAIYLKQAKKNDRVAIAHSHNVSEKKWSNPRSIIWEMFSYPTRYIADNRFACGYDAGRSRYGTKFLLNNSANQVINNGIDIEKFTFDPIVRDTIRENFKVSENTLVVGNVGRFEYQKNHEFILKIFSALQKIEPNSELWLVGDGELREQMEDKVKKMGLSKSIRFLGIRKDANQLMMAFDTLLMPSHFEGLPVSMIEAQATGLMEIVSDVIDTKADVTGNVKFISLASSPEKWAQELLTQKNIFVDRKAGAGVVAESGYSVERIAAHLQNFYLKVTNKM